MKHAQPNFAEFVFCQADEEVSDVKAFDDANGNPMNVTLMPG